MKKRIVSLFALAITGLVCLTLYSLGDIHLVMEIMGIEQYEETIHAKEDIKTTIVLDSGHGGYDTGCIANDGTYEKDITLAIALKTGALLSSYGYHVVYTRTSDEVSWSNNNKDDLATRVAIAQETDADYYISIHMNASENNDGANGFEIYVKGNNERILQIASRLESSLTSLAYTNDRGIKTTASSPLYVIDNNTVPAMLIEYGFLTDQNDAAYVCSEDGQQKLAQQLAISIQKNVPLSKS